VGDVVAVGVVPADDESFQELAVLHDDRVGETQLRTDALERHRVGGLADVEQCRIAAGQLGHHEEDAEGDQRDHQQGEHGVEDPPNEISQHDYRPNSGRAPIPCGTGARPLRAAFTCPSIYPLLRAGRGWYYLPSLTPRDWKSTMPNVSWM
jgi:hypothetical protein